MTYSFDAEVWLWEGGEWHFASLPEDVADDIEERHGQQAGGFGSIRVEAVIGSTRWRTSVFPDKKRGTYLLPLKKAVRAAEGLSAGSTARIELQVLV